MIPADLFYSSPGYARLFFVTPLILLLFLFLVWWRQRAFNRYASHSVLSKIFFPLPKWNLWLRILLICGAWFFAVVALMGPEGNGHYLTAPPAEKQLSLRMKPHQVLFLLDTSASMGTADEKGGRTRLALAKEVIEETVKGLKGETVSLYGFTSEPEQFIPETMDSIYFRLRLDDIEINEGGATGTNLGAALKEVLRSASKDTSVIVLSDGGEESIDPDLKGIQLFTVGLGTETGGMVPDFDVRSSLNEKVLYELANKAGGNYYSAERLSPLEIAQDLTSRLNRKSTIVAERGDAGAADVVYDSYYQYPLGLTILLLLTLFLIPGRGR